MAPISLPDAEIVELERIRELHRRDQEAALRGDADALSALWTDDIVSLAPGAPIRRGKEEALASLRASLDRSRDYETVEYALDFEEVRVLGDYAFDWGTLRGAVRPRGGGPEVRTTGKMLRILQRGADGEWRVHRTIWNIDAPPG